MRMRFCAGLFFPSEIETEIFSALMAEFKKVLVQDRATDLTMTDLHPDYNPSQPPFRKGRRSIIPPFIKGDNGGLPITFSYGHATRYTVTVFLIYGANLVT